MMICILCLDYVCMYVCMYVRTVCIYIYALTTAPSKYVEAVPKLMLTFPSATRMGP